MTVRSRLISTPAEDSGTKIIECCLCCIAGESDLHITIAISQSGFPGPEMNHFRPLTTHESPSTLALVEIFVASDDATSASVIAKQERILPSSSGTSQRCCCSGVPKAARMPIFPVSGGLQLKTSGAHSLQPITSAMGAYSRLDRLAPYCS